jgi:thioesterase domain-containing protein
LDLHALRDHLAKLLPEYMIPSAFVGLESLPLTVNGKLDRRALPRPQSSGIAAKYVAPATPAEIVLCSTVEALLGVEHVGVADNFFHLGGHSLLAVRLVAMLRARLGIEAPVHLVFEAPMLRDFARRMGDASEGSAAFEGLLCLRSSGDLSPLFCLHPVGGLCWPYMALLAFTPERQPVYGLQSSGWQAEAEMPGTMDEVLDECERNLVRVAGDGPVRLMGWSFGGMLAHLLATRLQAKGRVVEWLTIFDAYPPPPREVDAYLYDPESDAIWRDLAATLDLEIPREFADLPLDARVVRRIALEGSHSLATLTEWQLERFAKVMANNTRLMHGIEFGKFEGKIHFVSASRRPAEFNRNHMNPALWQPYCSGGVMRCVVDSTHNRMLTADSLRQVVAEYLGQSGV